MFLRPSAGVVVTLSLGVSVVTEGSGSHLSSPAGSSVIPGLIVASSGSCAPLGFSAGAAGDSGCSPGPCGPTAGAAPSPASIASSDDDDDDVLGGDCGVVLTGTTSTGTVPPFASISSLSGFVSAVVVDGAGVEVDSDAVAVPSETAEDVAVALEEVNNGVVVDLVVAVVVVVEVLVVIAVVVVDDWVVLVVVVFGSVVVDVTSIFEVVVVLDVVVVEVVVVVVEVVVVVMVTVVGAMLVVVVACVVLVSFFAGATPPILKPASEPSG